VRHARERRDENEKAAMQGPGPNSPKSLQILPSRGGRFCPVVDIAGMTTMVAAQVAVIASF
jgi:hypothetical protein